MSTLAACMGAWLSSARAWFSDCHALFKPRLNLLVLMVAAAGFVLGSSRLPEAAAEAAAAEGSCFVRLLYALGGILMVAVAASILNQVCEREADARMPRTRGRPLPAGRVPARWAALLGVLLGLGGTLFLAWTSNLMAAALAALTLALYIFLYTPLKRRTPFNTLVGAFPGALPTLIGWAAGGKLDGSAGTLFAIVFLWQMPHFFSIAWLYRHEYAHGGFKMLPVVEPDGKSTGRRAVLYAAALVPIAWMPTAFGLTGWNYALGATLLSLAFLGTAVDFACRRSTAAARRLFLASVIYLPLLLGLIFLDPSS